MTVRMLVIPRDNYVNRPQGRATVTTATPMQLAIVAWCYSSAVPDAEKPLECDPFNTTFAHHGRYAIIRSSDEIPDFYEKLRTYMPMLPDKPALIAEFPHDYTGVMSDVEEVIAPRVGHVAARAGWEEPPHFAVQGKNLKLTIPSFELGAKFRMLWTPPD